MRRMHLVSCADSTEATISNTSCKLTWNILLKQSGQGLDGYQQHMAAIHCGVTNANVAGSNADIFVS